MKIEERKIYMTEKFYIAEDGTEFRNKYECFKYEAKNSQVFRKFSEIPFNTEKFDADDAPWSVLTAFFFRNSDDIDAMNAWLDMISLWEDNDADALPRFIDTDIGETVVFSVDTCYDEDAEYDSPKILDFIWMSYKGTADEMKKSYCNHIDSFTKYWMTW